MRLALVALILLLALTLGNAFYYRRDVGFVHARAYAPVQLSSAHARHYEWDAFVWREIVAVIATALLYGIVAAAGPRNRRSRRR